MDSYSTIWKFPFEVADTVAVEMPRDAQVLHVECQYGRPCLWACVDPQADRVRRHFWIFGTGHPIARVETLKHVATFQQGSFVWHMFEAE